MLILRHTCNKSPFEARHSRGLCRIWSPMRLIFALILLSAGPAFAQLPNWQLTFRWQPVTQYYDGALIPTTTPVTYVLTWYGTDAAGVANTPSADVVTAGPPLVVTVPYERICARVRAKVNGVLGDPSQQVCIARKPGVPANVTVEFGVP